MADATRVYYVSFVDLILKMNSLLVPSSSCHYTDESDPEHISKKSNLQSILSIVAKFRALQLTEDGI